MFNVTWSTITSNRLQHMGPERCHRPTTNPTYACLTISISLSPSQEQYRKKAHRPPSFETFAISNLLFPVVSQESPSTPKCPFLIGSRLSPPKPKCPLPTGSRCSSGEIARDPASSVGVGAAKAKLIVARRAVNLVMRLRCILDGLNDCKVWMW